MFYQITLQLCSNCIVVTNKIPEKLPLSLVCWEFLRKCQKLVSSSLLCVLLNSSHFDYFVAIVFGMELGRWSMVVVNVWVLNILRLTALKLSPITFNTGARIDFGSLIRKAFFPISSSALIRPKLLLKIPETSVPYKRRL